MLREFLTTHHDELVARTRLKIAARRSPPPTADELETGVPILLNQITDALRRSESVTGAHVGATAGAHGPMVSRGGPCLHQVVHDYGDACQAITELAVDLKSSITNDEFRALNRCLDEAITTTVIAYAEQGEPAFALAAAERLGLVAHELDDLVTTARLSFDPLKDGIVGTKGSTAAVHDRALEGLRTLIDRWPAKLNER